MEKKQIPIKEGLFELSQSARTGTHLVGSKCKNCGEIYFPKKEICLKCSHMEFDKIALSTRGKLFTFTVVTQAPPGSIVQAPYGLGLVKLPEGVFVNTILTENDINKLRIGQDMELVIEKVKEDKEGNSLMAYKFKPVQ